MPRFTTAPGGISCAARRAIPSLSNISGLRPRANGAILERVLVVGHLDNPLYEDPRQVNVVRVDVAQRHHLIDLRNRGSGGGGHDGAEVPCGAPEPQVA